MKPLERIILWVGLIGGILTILGSVGGFFMWLHNHRAEETAQERQAQQQEDALKMWMIQMQNEVAFIGEKLPPKDRREVRRMLDRDTASFQQRFGNVITPPKFLQTGY